jgi:hypothetical protein
MQNREPGEREQGRDAQRAHAGQLNKTGLIIGTGPIPLPYLDVRIFDLSHWLAPLSFPGTADSPCVRHPDVAFVRFFVGAIRGSL